MKTMTKRILASLMLCCLLFSFTACGGGEDSGSKAADTSAVAGEYYIDLTDLGMKLTVFLRLNEDGTFLFSNTLDFEVNKSSGTFQESEGEYMMIFETVNGEEKSLSDGLTSGFRVMEDGNLDFSGYPEVPYGTATIDTVSDADPSIKLTGVVVTEDYSAPSTETSFKIGSYAADSVEKDGVYYNHVVSFFEDLTYLHFVSYKVDGVLHFYSENGTYGVSTTQLALGSDHSERVSCEIIDESNLKLSVIPYPDAEERMEMAFVKADSVPMLGTFSGTGTVTGSDETFDVELTIYRDGTYETSAQGFTETGMIVLNSADSVMKQYPDHPETGARGLTQVGTVPSGSVSSDGGVTITDLRVRTSEGLTRYACTVTE